MKKFGILFLIFSFALQVHAQSEGGLVPSPASTLSPSSTAPKNAGSVASPKVVPTSTPKPTPVLAPIATLPVGPVLPEPEPSSNIFTIVLALSGVLLGALGFFGLKLKKKKEEKDDSKCLNFKKLMEEKLAELTDLKARLKDLIKDKTVEQIRQISAGTPAGKLFISVEETQKAYKKLKELYEKCLMDFSVPKTTLLFLYKPAEKKILLGMKKRRFGEGKWNGIGGKLLKGETITQALIRETKEEIGVSVKGNDLKQVATLDFAFKDNPDWNQQTHVFLAERWQGEPIETEETIPKWHQIDSIPFEKMWVDDMHWLPRVLQGENILASFTFDKQGSEIVHMKVEKNAKN